MEERKRVFPMRMIDVERPHVQTLLRETFAEDYYCTVARVSLSGLQKSLLSLSPVLTVIVSQSVSQSIQADEPRRQFLVTTARLSSMRMLDIRLHVAVDLCRRDEVDEVDESVLILPACLPAVVVVGDSCIGGRETVAG